MEKLVDTGKVKNNVNSAQLKLAATLRTGTAGSQDESRCSAIHKFNFRIKGDRAGGTPALPTAARGQKKLPKGFPSGGCVSSQGQSRVRRSAVAGAACVIRR